MRPLFPLIIKQDMPDSGGFPEKTYELGDITYDVSVFNTSANGFIYGGGVAGSMPSATDDALGLNQWLLGPEVIFALMKPWGVIGLIASHQWDVAGSNDNSTSVIGGRAWKFGLQYWYYIESPDQFGPQHQIRLQIAPVLSLPW